MVLSAKNSAQRQSAAPCIAKCSANLPHALLEPAETAVPQQEQLIRKDPACEGVIMRADRPMLTKIGILYNSQSSLNLTPTKKIMLSVINSLCAGRFAGEHDGFISLNDDQIADRTCGWFSARQVGRHISDLIEKGILMSYFSEGKRWVGLKSGKASAGKFMTVVSITTDQNLFCASEILILSKLLDRAAFHYRAGVGLVTDKVFMKNLQDGLYPMCIRSIRQGLGKLKAKGLLSYVEESSSSLMPVVFSEAVTSQYVSLLRLKPSEKCRKLVYKQAVERLLRSEKASELTVSVKEERAARAQERVRRNTGDGWVYHTHQETRAETWADTRAGRAVLWKSLLESKTGEHAYVTKAFELTDRQLLQLTLGLSGVSGLSAKKGIPHSRSRQKRAKPTAEVGKKRQSPLYTKEHIDMYGSECTDLTVGYTNSHTDLTSHFHQEISL